jgi:hypothetical protein
MKSGVVVDSNTSLNNQSEEVKKPALQDPTAQQLAPKNSCNPYRSEEMLREMKSKSSKKQSESDSGGWSEDEETEKLRKKWKRNGDTRGNVNEDSVQGEHEGLIKNQVS